MKTALLIAALTGPQTGDIPVRIIVDERGDSRQVVSELTRDWNKGHTEPGREVWLMKQRLLNHFAIETVRAIDTDYQDAPLLIVGRKQPEKLGPYWGSGSVIRDIDRRLQGHIPEGQPRQWNHRDYLLGEEMQRRVRLMSLPLFEDAE